MGSPDLSQDTPETLSSTSTAMDVLTEALASRRIATAPAPENSPRRPFFQSAESAASISRQVNLSDGTDTSSDRSKVTSTIFTKPKNYRRDDQVEQPFRAVSDALTTRGDVFRVLYVGQAITDQKDSSGNLGEVESASEIGAEFLGEAFVERQAKFDPDPTASPAPSASTIIKTVDSTYRVRAAERSASEKTPHTRWPGSILNCRECSCSGRSSANFVCVTIVLGSRRCSGAPEGYQRHI